MGANASKVKAQFDKSSLATLRNVTDGAETSTATEASIDLNLLTAAYWQDDTVPHGTFKVVFYVTALDLTDTTETYTISLQVDDVSAQNNSPQTVWSQLITSTGVYEAVVDSKTIDQIVTDYSSDALYLAAKATLGGDTPSITYGAWVAEVVAH